LPGSLSGRTVPGRRLSLHLPSSHAILKTAWDPQAV
jgi:hypothetical protein